MEAYRHCMGSTKMIIRSWDIFRHFSLFILGRSCQTSSFIPLSYLIIRLNEGLVEIKPNNGDRKSENVIFLASDVLFISTSGAFGVAVVLVGATKIFFCSDMIEYNATEHFHADFTVQKNFHSSVWPIPNRNFYIEITMFYPLCFKVGY